MTINIKYSFLLACFFLAAHGNLHAQRIRWNILLETKDPSVVMAPALANEIRLAVNAKLSSFCKDSVPSQEVRFQKNKVSLILNTAIDTTLLAKSLAIEPSLLFLAPYPTAIVDRVKTEIAKLEENHIDKIIILAPQGEKNAQLGISQLKDTVAMQQIFAQLSKKSIIPADGKVYCSNRPKESEAFGITHGLHLLNKEKPILQGNFVKAAKAMVDKGQPIVKIQLNKTAGNILADYTKHHIGEVIGIIINGKIVMDPFIYGPLENGIITLNGLGTIAQTKEIADQISNQYPVAMKLVGIYPMP